MSNDLTKEVVFRCVSPGMYDDTMECVICGFTYCRSADADPGENEKRAEHDCNEQ